MVIDYLNKRKKIKSENKALTMVLKKEMFPEAVLIDALDEDDEAK